MGIQIEPCPCGGIPVAHSKQCSEDVVDSWVECPKCGKIGGEVEHFYGAKEAAIATWNEEVKSVKTGY